MAQGVMRRIEELSEERERLLRRWLMSNSGRRRRSRTLMLVPNLRPKVVPHNGSGLLLGLIVRACGRLVALRRSPKHEGSRPSGPSHGPGGFDPGDPRP